MSSKMMSRISRTAYRTRANKLDDIIMDSQEWDSFEEYTVFVGVKQFEGWKTIIELVNMFKQLLGGYCSYI